MYRVTGTEYKDSPQEEAEEAGSSPLPRGRYLAQLLGDTQHALLVQVLHNGHLQDLLLLLPRVPHRIRHHSANLRVKVLMGPETGPGFSIQVSCGAPHPTPRHWLRGIPTLSPRLPTRSPCQWLCPLGRRCCECPCGPKPIFARCL